MDPIGDLQQYEDLMAVMAEKLGAEVFMKELLKGFDLLADPRRGLITPESLAASSELLGLEQLSLEDVKAMVKEGDLDGDGALNQTEFCVLMVKLSPGIMKNPDVFLHSVH